MLLFAVAFFLGPAPASAQEAEGEAAEELTVSSQIASIREMLLYARYGEAAPMVEALLGRDELLASERNEVLEIRAILFLARRRTRRGMEVLRELYGRDPEHRLIDRDVGPSVRAAFERVHAERPPTATVTLENGTLPELEGRVSPAIAARLAEGANVAHEVRLNYRNGDSGPFERALMRFDATRGLARSRLPLAEGTEAYEVHYFFEVLAPSQAVVGTLGSRAEPLSLAVPAEAPRPGAVSILPTSGERPAESLDVAPGMNVLEEWWFWTIVVVVAGGAAAVGTLYGTGNLDAIGPGSLGAGRL